MKLLIFILALSLDWIPSGQAQLEALQKRDSILVADQLEYGFELKGVEAGTSLALQDFSSISNDTLILVRNWKIDTLRKAKDIYDIKASVCIAPFEEGIYDLPPILVQRILKGGQTDTLEFESVQMDVRTIPIDTASFVIHDIKDQMRYPLTFKETIPYLAGILLLALLVFAIIYFIKQARLKKGLVEGPKESPYIVALRSLDKLRSNTLWAADKQKFFYSAITDALKIYISDSFIQGATEMTTAELFEVLKNCKELSPDIYSESKELFELADYVKFAKHLANDEENSKALPAAIRFVMNTYQNSPEQEPESKEDVL